MVGGNINFIVVYEGQCSDACVYLMTFKVLFKNTGRQFRGSCSWLFAVLRPQLFLFCSPNLSSDMYNLGYALILSAVFLFLSS